MNNQELKNISMFNITKYLSNCYESKIEPSNDIMKDINFSEVSSKEITYFEKSYGHYRNTITESLAQNCISNLPYEAYEKFVNLNWIYFQKDYNGNIIRSSILEKNISLIEKLHDIGLDSALNDREARHGYIKRCLDNIFSFDLLEKNTHFPINDKDFAQRYLALMKKTASELEYFQQIVYVGDEKKPLKYSPNVDWLKVASNIKSGSSPSALIKNNILEIIAAQSELLPLFEDALLLLMKNDSKNLKGILGFSEINRDDDYYSSRKNIDTPTNILSVAFDNNNLVVAKMIVESLGLSPKDCLMAYEQNITHAIDNLPHEDYDNEKKHPLSLIIKEYFNSSYGKIKKEFFPELDTGYLSLFVLGKDKKLKQQLLDNKEITFDIPISEFRDELNQFEVKTKNSPIIDEFDDEEDEEKFVYNVEFNFNDVLFTAKIIDKLNEFSNIEGKKLIYTKDSSTLNCMQFNDFVIDYILRFEKELLDSVDVNSIPDNHWNKINKPDALNHLKEVLRTKQGNKELTIELSDFKLLLETVKLEVELGKDNTTVSKSNKFKI